MKVYLMSRQVSVDGLLISRNRGGKSEINPAISASARSRPTKKNPGCDLLRVQDTIPYDTTGGVKLYLALARHSTKLGHIQYIRCEGPIAHGINTFFSPCSRAVKHRRATASRLRPVLFGSASRALPPSTADARKSPSMVLGRNCVNAMHGCSIERAW
jgi:hypothetical protein